MSAGVIELRAVSRRFGETRAVDGVDLTVREGEVLGLIGRNGAGKTTLFKLMLGLLPASCGEIAVLGEAVRGAAFREVRRAIGYLPESVAFYDHLSGLETLRFFARLKGAATTCCPGLLERVGLAQAARRPVGHYSKGMKQRLAFALALLGSPRILFLDEPTNGMDPQGIRDFYQILGALRDSGTTAVLTSHILAEIQLRVDRLALMADGRIRALGTVQGLREALNLPVAIRVSLHNGAEDALRRVLSNRWIVRVADSTAWLQCARGEKMSVLGALAALDDGVLDIQIEEPSLEEVFLGYSEAAS